MSPLGSNRALRWSFGVGLLLLCFAMVGRAEPAPSATTSGPEELAAELSSVSCLNGAEEHFDRGMQLTRHGEHEAAIGEFLRAYACRPHPAVLHNVSQTYVKVQNYRAALYYFQRYLAEAGAGLAPAERHAAEEQLALLQKRAVEAQHEAPMLQKMKVSLYCPYPQVQAEIDGKLLTTVPEHVELALGEHAIRFLKYGFDSSTRTLRIDGKAPQRVSCQFSADSDVGATGEVRVKGAPAQLSLLNGVPWTDWRRVPVGKHRVTILVSGKPHVRQISVVLGQVHELVVEQQEARPRSPAPGRKSAPRPEPRKRRSTSTAAYVLAGGAVLAGAVAFKLHFDNRIRDERWEKEDRALSEATMDTHSPEEAEFLRERADRNNDLAETIAIYDGVTVGLGVVVVGAVSTAAYLVFWHDDDTQIHLATTGTGLQLSGRF